MSKVVQLMNSGKTKNCGLASSPPIHESEAMGHSGLFLATLSLLPSPLSASGTSGGLLCWAKFRVTIQGHGSVSRTAAASSISGTWVGLGAWGEPGITIALFLRIVGSSEHFGGTDGRGGTWGARSGLYDSKGKKKRGCSREKQVLTTWKGQL